MNIYSLTFLLLFKFAFAFPVTDSEQKPTSPKPGVANLVFKSADGGQSWQNISEGLPGDKLEGSLFVNDGGFYLRTGKYIYHSKPNNKAPFWEKESFPDEHSNIAPGKNGMFAYDYHQGKFRQRINGSAEWKPVYENFQLKGIIDVVEITSGTVFIVCDRGRGLYRSTDKGKNWKEVTRGVWKLVESNGVLMANSVNGTIRSTDDGKTWETVISEGGVGIDITRIDGGFASITFNTQSNTRRIRVSYDGGKTWQPIDAGLQTSTFGVPVAKPFSQMNQPDSVWNPIAINTELPEQAFISSIVQVGEDFFCGHPAGIFKTSDKGKTWKLILPSVDGKVFNLSVSGGVIYAIPRNRGC
ncbi:hypothetical protein WG954_00770 [Lacibacter sp. H375]|uniref:WD40/YVTN/BNR-like repeat-containing protein n=1 Tax=Lacibacter sp. H375 TaxID=3133424 RepID=UPI0030C467D3